MKKAAKIFCALFIAITFAACEGDRGPMGLPGTPGEGTNWYPAKITINRDQWKLVGNIGDLNSYYTAEIQLPELTRSVFDEGAVIAYIEPEQGIKNGLPYVLHKGQEINGKDYLWTQTYDFDYEIGYVTFYLTYSDFETGEMPDTETFHVLLMW